MHAFHQLPSDLFYEIALHLPLTKDVLAFSLTNTRIHEALSTPSLFMARLTLRGWDISAWKDEADAAQSPGDSDLKRWVNIDYVYCRTVQLFDEAAVDHGHFLITTDTPTDKIVLWGSGQPTGAPGQDNRIPNNSRQVFDGDRTAKWLEKLSKVLPLFVIHHRGGNISRIMDAKHRDSLRAYVRVVDDLGIVIRFRLEYPVHVPAIGEVHGPTVAKSDYGWCERICFSLIALLIQCDASTIASIFTDIKLASTALGLAMDPPVDPHTMQMSEHYVGIFLFQAALYITLHLDAAFPATSSSGRPPLLAPTIPHFEPHATPSYPCYTTHSHMRPWMCDGLAGTPLANLSSTTGHAWDGYCTYDTRERHDPMYLELRASPPPSDSDSDPDTDPGRMSYFRGEGHDSIGPFTISGSYDSNMGVVRAITAYEMHQWDWHGMLTPFGIAGLWGPRWRCGWWWIWPREWSPTTTQYD